MMQRLTAAALTLSLLAPALPAIAADETIPVIEVSLPSELTCQGKEARARASCITDTLKKLKKLEHEYDMQEDDAVEAWRDAHKDMGVSPEYQRLLRAYHAGLLKNRRAFRARLLALQKAFFAQQKEKRTAGGGSSSSSASSVTPMDSAEYERAKARCGEEDDDGAYRICMRLQLRIRAQNVDRRSQKPVNVQP